MTGQCGRRTRPLRPRHPHSQQYAWWAIGIVLVVAYLFIGMMGVSHEGATVVIGGERRK